jgi:acyl carrier protein
LLPIRHSFKLLPRHIERNIAALEPVKIRSLDEIKQELKQLFVENLSLEELKPEDIRDDMNLFGDGGVGLDSLDGVEIVVLLRRQYGLDVKAMQKGRDIFQSINTLAPYVLANATK